MELEAAKMIGAGLAVIGFGGVGVGIGNIFATYIASVARNPSVASLVSTDRWIGFALVEAVALYALVIAFMILFL